MSKRPRSPLPPRQGGVALRWSADKGFGFIRPHDGGEELFCHQSAIEDGDALCEGFDVGFVRAFDEQRGKSRAAQVTGGVGEALPADPLAEPCLPYGSEVLTAPEQQPSRPEHPSRRRPTQEATDASWLLMSTMVRSIGQAELEIELSDGAQLRGTLYEADARMNLKLRDASTLRGCDGPAHAVAAGDAGAAPAHTAGTTSSVEPPQGHLAQEAQLHGSLSVDGSAIRSIRIPREIDAVRAFHTRLKQVDKGLSTGARRIKKPLPTAPPPTVERAAPLVSGFTRQADAYGGDGLETFDDGHATGRNAYE